MDNDVVIEARNLGKAYRIWSDPSARLKFPLIKLATEWLPPVLQPKQIKAGDRNGFYRDFHALRDVSFEVRRGEALGIIGRNGSGKSTLLQMIAGTLTPSSGSICKQGRIAALLELGSGFNPDFTGRENVHLNAAILGLSPQEVDEAFDDIAAFADIGEFMDQPIRTYSSGMVLRLAFAVMAHVKADILIVDEALAVGDVFFVQKCMRWIRKFRENGTLLFVTHNTADVMALCDRAIWLKDGRTQMMGDAKSVAENYLAYFHAAATGGKVVEARKEAAPVQQAAPSSAQAVDQRLPWLNATQFRNDLTPTVFDPDQAWFGTGDAKIVDVEFCDQSSGRRLSNIVGGEAVTLRITCEAVKTLQDPIVGFYLKDRLGQYLFGDNTYLSNSGRKLEVPAGGRVVAEFSFQMPLLPKGKYAIAPAIATGSQDSHAQQCWIHEAVILESSNQFTHRGLVAIPMQKIQTRVEASSGKDVL